MKSDRLRFLIQGGFLFFLSWVGYRHQVVGGGPEGVPPVDALCPFGGLESLHSLFVSGAWLRRVAPSSLILLMTFIVVTLMVGRIFCGWICPLGTLGEWTAGIAHRLGIRRRELPEGMDRKLRWTKYIAMILVVGLAWWLGKLAWRDLDPWVAWMHLSAGMEGFRERPWAFLTLFGTVIGASLFIERFWCRYLCPLGAFLAILQKFSLFKVQRTPATCIRCSKCDVSCPVQLHPMKTERVTSAECLACGRCTDNCPVDRTLTFARGARHLSALSVGLIGLVLFFSGYGLSRVTGYWQTFAEPPAELLPTSPVDAIYGWMNLEQVAETVGLPLEKVRSVAGLLGDTPTDISLKKLEGVDDEEVREKLRDYLEKDEREAPPSSLPPDQIRGSMTLEQVAASYNLEASVILKRAGWPEEAPQDVPLKELKGLYGLEVEAIRQAVRELIEN